MKQKSTPTDTQDLLLDRVNFASPTFSLSNRLRRALWLLAWALLASWTPPPAHRWRIALLRLFGANVSWKASVYRSVKIWAPWHLTMADYACLGPGVTVYNIELVRLETKAVVSQGAHLCTGTHDHRDPAFPLYARPIHVGAQAWICAESFVGPGVAIGDGAVLAARGVAFKSLESWRVYLGNPAVEHSRRSVRD